MKKINWGIVGYASIAKESGIPAILDSKHSHLYALASQDEEEIQEARIKEPFDRIYGSYEELLEDRDVQAVYIPLPNSLHKEWT
uniref:Gfo/Idh/MocA family protein n=1 Tax=Proteiniclasticum ruminis TaxID=398199 RepID=UPI0028A61738